MASLDNSSINQNSSMTMEGGTHTCTICCESFTTRECLEKHTLSHIGEGPILCSICNKLISRQDLKRHSLMHRAEKPHICNICNKAFAKKSVLNKHITWHGQNRPFACDVCNKSFITKFHLDRHWVSHSKEQSYTCDVCNRSFSRKCSLTRHAVTHLKRPSHICLVCNEAFDSAEKLKEHSVIHRKKTPAKPGKRVLYTIDQKGSSEICSFCGKVFTEPVCAKLLFSHQDGIDPYACNSCLRDFVEKSSQGNQATVTGLVQSVGSENSCSVYPSSYIVPESCVINPVNSDDGDINNSIKNTSCDSDETDQIEERDDIALDIQTKCDELEEVVSVKEELDVDYKKLDTVDIKEETDFNYEVTENEEKEHSLDPCILAKEKTSPFDENSKEEFNVIFVNVKEEQN